MVSIQTTVFKLLYSDWLSWFNLHVFDEDYESLRDVGHSFCLRIQMQYGMEPDTFQFQLMWASQGRSWFHPRVSGLLTSFLLCSSQVYSVSFHSWGLSSPLTLGTLFPAPSKLLVTLPSYLFCLSANASQRECLRLRVKSLTKILSVLLLEFYFLGKGSCNLAWF